jgi:hypothetical protein
MRKTNTFFGQNFGKKSTTILTFWSPLCQKWAINVTVFLYIAIHTAIFSLTFTFLRKNQGNREVFFVKLFRTSLTACIIVSCFEKKI